MSEYTRIFYYPEKIFKFNEEVKMRSVHLLKTDEKMKASMEKLSETILNINSEIEAAQQLKNDGKLAEALEKTRTAQKLALELKDPAERSSALIGVFSMAANIYSKHQQFDDAIKFFKKAQSRVMSSNLPSEHKTSKLLTLKTAISSTQAIQTGKCDIGPNDKVVAYSMKL